MTGEEKLQGFMLDIGHIEHQQWAVETVDRGDRIGVVLARLPLKRRARWASETWAVLVMVQGSTEPGMELADLRLTDRAIAFSVSKSWAESLQPIGVT